MISLVVAAAKNGVIGSKGQIPWRLPADMAHFKQLTMGHPVVMGRKTFESIGRPLPGRSNIVITRSRGFRAAGCQVANSLSEALESASHTEGSGEIFIIGGSQIYEMALPAAERIYLTVIKAEVKGDTYFKYDPADWRQVSSQKHAKDGKNQYPFEFRLLERIR